MNTTKEKKVRNFKFGPTKATNSSILPNIIDKKLPNSQLFMTTKNQDHKILYSAQFSTKNSEKSKTFAKFPKTSQYSGESTERSIKIKAPKDHNRCISIVEINTLIDDEKLHNLQENPKEEPQKTQKTEELFHRLMQALSEVNIFGTTQSESIKVKNLSESANAKKKIMEILYKAFDAETKENDEDNNVDVIQYNQKYISNKDTKENKKQSDTDFAFGYSKNRALEESKLDLIEAGEESKNDSRQNDMKITICSKNIKEINEDAQYDIGTGIKTHKANQSELGLNFVNDLTKTEIKTEETQLNINQDVSPTRKFKPKSTALCSTKKNSISLSDFKTLKAINHEQTTDNNFIERKGERKRSSIKLKLTDDKKKTAEQKNKELKQKLKDENETVNILKQEINRNYEKYRIELIEKANLIQKLYEKVYSLQAENSNFANKIQLLEKNIAKLQRTLEKKEKKTNLASNPIINELKEKNTYFEHKNVNLQLANTQIQSEFEAYKSKAQEKEVFFEASIIKLTALLQKNRKHSINYISHTKNNNYITEKLEENRIEENQKLINRLGNMEEDIKTHKNDIEKYKQDFEYLNKLLEEKNEDIKEIEYRKKCEIDDEMISQRKKTIRELLKFVKEFEKSKGKFFNMQRCEKCRNSTIRQVVVPCDNGFCKRTDDIEDVCLYCNNQGKGLKIRMIKELIVEIKNKFMGLD